MSVLEQVALAWGAVLRTLGALRRPATWAPWLALGAVQLAALALLWNVAHPWISAWLAPLVVRLVGERALHYPDLFAELPSLYATADLAISLVLGSLAVGAATRLFADAFAARPPRASAALAEASRRAPALILSQLPFHLIALGLAFGVGGWMDRAQHSLMVRLLGNAVVIGGTVLAQTLFFYVAALVVLEDRGALDALRELPRTWSRGFWAALFLGLLLLAALMPIQFIQDRASLLASRGQPELVVALAGVQIAITLLVWCVLSGGATLVYLVQIAPEEDAR
jgi:hypothetical protein